MDSGTTTVEDRKHPLMWDLSFQNVSPYPMCCLDTQVVCLRLDLNGLVFRCLNCGDDLVFNRR